MYKITILYIREENYYIYYIIYKFVLKELKNKFVYLNYEYF